MTMHTNACLKGYTLICKNVRSMKPFSCFPRSRGGIPVLLDEEEIERRLLERREVARAFKAQRKEVENRREQDRLDRNAAKERQLQEAEELQV